MMMMMMMCLLLPQEPKMTRSKFKEVVERGVVSPSIYYFSLSLSISLYVLLGL